MQYSTRKELLEHRYMAVYGRLDFCSMFTVSAQEKVIGKFFHSDTVSIIGFGDNDIRIEYINKFLRQTQYPIIDQNTNQIIGRYDRKEKTSDWTPYGKLYLGDQVYQSKKVKGDWSKSDKNSKGFIIKVDNFTESVNFVVQVPRPKFFSFKSMPHGNTPFEGEVELIGHHNLLFLFSSMFLLQQASDFEDWN